MSWHDIQVGILITNIIDVSLYTILDLRSKQKIYVNLNKPMNDFIVSYRNVWQGGINSKFNNNLNLTKLNIKWIKSDFNLVEWKLIVSFKINQF